MAIEAKGAGSGQCLCEQASLPVCKGPGWPLAGVWEVLSLLSCLIETVTSCSERSLESARGGSGILTT